MFQLVVAGAGARNLNHMAHAHSHSVSHHNELPVHKQYHTSVNKYQTQRMYTNTRVGLHTQTSSLSLAEGDGAGALVGCLLVFLHFSWREIFGGVAPGPNIHNILKSQVAILIAML